MILIIVITFIASWFAGWMLKRKFAKYSKTVLQSNLSGQEIAELMLADHQITDVKVYSVEGKLTDHYDPTNRTVNLSPDVYYGRNAAAAAVAAHECGHAVQHAQAYSMLKFRSAMVPALSATSNYMPWVIMAGALMLSITPIPLAIGVVLFAFTTLFSFVTLPVEFDASRRALAWVERRQIVTAQEHAWAKDALWWAAMTYVIAALASLATLMYYALMLFSGRR